MSYVLNEAKVIANKDKKRNEVNGNTFYNMLINKYLERLFPNIGLTSNRFRYGGSMKRQKAKDGWWGKLSDGQKSGILRGGMAAFDTGMNIASGLINNSMINSMQSPKEYSPYEAIKLPTRININPQSNNLYQSENNALETIKNNTASSRGYVSRTQDIREKYGQARQELFANKNNIENQLLRQDLTNQQNIHNQNINLRNQYNDRVTAFNNQKAEFKADNINNVLQGISGATSTLVNGILSDKARSTELAAIAAMNENGAEPVQRAVEEADMNFWFTPEQRQRRAERQAEREKRRIERENERNQKRSIAETQRTARKQKREEERLARGNNMFSLTSNVRPI